MLLEACSPLISTTIEKHNVSSTGVKICGKRDRKRFSKWYTTLPCLESDDLINTEPGVFKLQ